MGSQILTVIFGFLQDYEIPGAGFCQLSAGTPWDGKRACARTMPADTRKKNIQAKNS